MRIAFSTFEYDKRGGKVFLSLVFLCRIRLNIIPQHPLDTTGINDVHDFSFLQIGWENSFHRSVVFRIKDGNW